MNLYAYCVSSNVSPDGRGDVTGIKGRVTRVVTCDGIAAVVSDFEDQDLALNRENVLAHERVIDGVLQWTTPLPFRFGVIVSPERLLEYLGSERNVLLEALSRVRGCVEMNVKIAGVGEGKVDCSGRFTSGPGPVTDRPLHPLARSPNPGPGTAFLKARERELQAQEMAERQAQGIAEELCQAVGGAVREKRTGYLQSRSLIISAAFLVERSRLAEYRDCLDQFRKHRPAARVLTSGPWPPYSFTAVSPGVPVGGEFLKRLVNLDKSR